MRQTEIFRTTTFRTAALAVAASGASTLLLFWFIYWQTAGLETARMDQSIRHEFRAVMRQDPAAIASDLSTRYAADLHREAVAGLFGRDARLLAGNLVTFPANLPTDGVPHQVRALRHDASGISEEKVRAMAQILPDGRRLVVGRSELQLSRLRELVVRALELGVLPGLFSALCIGVYASQRTLNRVQAVNNTIGRIMQGHLNERLEAGGGSDALEQLAGGVNRMLDEIERLVEEIRGVGDDIAHDLRTPLARVRARLENGRAHAVTLPELASVAEHAIADLDQALAMITALLRIGQIEGSARRAGFAPVSLAAIAREAAELYQPVAELRSVGLDVEADEECVVAGDRDLLFEVAANLLDNAVKFTPEGGRVLVRTYRHVNGPVLAVSDTGPGIPRAERAAALKRFYRLDRARQVPGHGLGLSLVAAIVRLHLFHLHMDEGSPGLLVEMRTWAADGVDRDG